MKCLLFALFHTLNKMASVLNCIQFCSCSLRLEGMFSHEDVKGSWPDILTLIRGLNKILQAMTLNHTETQALSIVKLKKSLSACPPFTQCTFHLHINNSNKSSSCFGALDQSLPSCHGRSRVNFEPHKVLKVKF